MPFAVANRFINESLLRLAAYAAPLNAMHPDPKRNSLLECFMASPLNLISGGGANQERGFLDPLSPACARDGVHHDASKVIGHLPMEQLLGECLHQRIGIACQRH